MLMLLVFAPDSAREVLERWSSAFVVTLVSRRRALDTALARGRYDLAIVCALPSAVVTQAIVAAIRQRKLPVIVASDSAELRDAASADDAVSLDLRPLDLGGSSPCGVAPSASLPVAAAQA